MLNAREMIITPEIAQRLLEKNTNNRNLSINTVNKYALDMLSGRWNEGNADPIVINKNGVLENGQHRLNAVIKAGVSVKFLLVENGESAGGTYDRGRARTTNDTLIINGLVDPAEIRNKVSMIRAMAQFKNESKLLSDSLIQDYLLDHEAEIYRALQATRNGRRKYACKNQGVARRKEIVLAAYCAMRCSIPAATLDDFFEVVNTGFMEYNWQTAAIILRNALIEKQLTIGKDFNNISKAYALYLTAEKAIIDYVKMNPRTRPYRITANTKNTFLDAVWERDKKYFVKED